MNSPVWRKEGWIETGRGSEREREREPMADSRPTSTFPAFPSGQQTVLLTGEDDSLMDSGVTLVGDTYEEEHVGGGMSADRL